MARRRMYLFERAYLDYAARLRDAWNWFLRVCSIVWKWFWSGGGATAIEFLLRICVVVSGVTLGILYVLYEKKHGRGLSGGTIFAFCAIVVYVSVLMWGWKAPVHIAARAVAGAVASGAVVLLAVGAMAVLLVFFAVYLLFLFLLTALSFIVFLPILAVEKIYRWINGITFECPYDNCPSKKGRMNPLPVHVCDCGAEYPNLYPNFYGIRHHTCRHPAHPDGEARLPTRDSKGRNKLHRRCAVCGGDLIHSELGLAAPRSIFVVGDSSSGKTVFICQALRELCGKIGRIPKAEAHVSSVKQQQGLDEQYKRLDKGALLAPSRGTVMEALGVVLSIPKRLKRTLLYMYDAPGEHFQTMSQFGQKQAMQNAHGIVLVADPSTFPGLSEYYGHDAYAYAPFADIAGNLGNVLGSLFGQDEDGRVDVPLAVVITKSDELPVDDLPCLAGFRNAQTGQPVLNAPNDQCREALRQLAGENAIQVIEQHFSRVRYFSCSALGRGPDVSDTSAFSPVGVLDPLLWLLGLDGAAAALVKKQRARRKKRFVIHKHARTAS